MEDRNMKKLWCCVLAVVLIMSIIPIEGNAAEAEWITFPDGSYMTIELITSQTKASGSVTGSKKSTYYSNSGAVEWIAVLTGSFSYTGSGSTCTASSMNITIQNNAWYIASKSATKSGNTAYGSATMGLRVGGITTNTVPVSLSLNCDANGNLS